jgi:antirestriction protein ArdC
MPTDSIIPTIPKTPATSLGSLSTPANQAKREHRFSVYEMITERIINLLEKGTVPWKRPWKASVALPRNVISQKAYRGINIFLLLSMGYESPFWLTFHQIDQLGGHVRKGEKACPVIFWKELTVDDKENDERARKIPMLRYYHVFNTTQCENLKGILPLSEQLATILKPAEILERMPQRPVIKHGMREAFYSPTEDCVGMPSLENFTSQEKYFSALFHEIIHSTGHEARLNRTTLSPKEGFGSDPYAKEELIAEMGAAFLCAHAGIAEHTVENSAAYINNWMGRLKNDKKLVVQAAAQAQAAADFILGNKPDTPPQAAAEVSPALPAEPSLS